MENQPKKQQFKIKTSHVMVIVFSLIAVTLTIYHSLLYPAPLAVFYVVLLAAIFTVMFVFLLYMSVKNINNAKSVSKTSVFLCIYTLLMIWLGINKTLPEYKEIMDFRKNRDDYVYWLYRSEFDTRRKLALLYLNAPESVDRIEPGVVHLGTKLVKNFLDNEIKAGNGANYSDDMYNLAEVAFIHSSRELAHEWYKKAYEHGKSNALERYQERIRHYK